MARLKEAATFLGEFRRTFKTTGSIIPSSRFLAQKITRFVRDAKRPAKFLEAGPGTGAFTGHLISLLQPEDQLVLVEINDRFVSILQDRLAKEPEWSKKRDQVKIIHGSIDSIEPTQQFRAIVCGLPFANFEPDLADRLMGHLISLVEPNGTFSFFEYWALRDVKASLVGSTERARLVEVGKIIEKYRREYGEKTDRVALNVPPALAHHLRKPA